MRYVAIETSGAVGGVALAEENGAPMVRTLAGARRHAGELVPLLHELLGKAGLTRDDVLCWSRGPGSFTGLRIGSSLVRAAVLATGCRVVSVCSLQAAAYAVRDLASPGGRIAALVDAKRGQVYTAVHENSGDELRSIADPRLITLGELVETFAPVLAVGEGLHKHAEACEAIGISLPPRERWSPGAAAVLELGRAGAQAGRFSAVEQVTPAYIRPPECEEFYEQRRATAIERRAARTRSDR